MHHPVRLFAVFVILLLAIAPFAQLTPALAASSPQPRPVTVSAERADNDDDDDDDDNGNRNDNDDDDDDNDDNDNEDDYSPPPQVAAPVAPPPPAPDMVARCLQNGDELVVEGPNGVLRVRSYQSNLNVDMRRTDGGSMPRPGAGEVLFAVRIGASPCGGPDYTELPVEMNVGMTYNDAAISGRDESKFALMFYDGQQWSVAPKHYTDVANNHVSSSTTRLGVYALVQR